ncbi:MAG TPA: hypothetical protein VIF15_01425, partial [Polyangiaceae bacterium]
MKTDARLSSLLPLLPLALAASCGGEPPPAPLPPPAAVVAPPPTSSTAATPSPPPSSDPTVLTDEERARDLLLTPRAAALVDAYSNMNGIFTSLVAQLTRDRKHVLYGSNRDGMPEIYLGDVGKPGDPPRALTSGPERSVWAALTWDGKYALYNRDQGADENWHIWRVALDGTGATDLTPGDKLHRDEPVLPRGKPGTMIYTQHVATSPASQLMVQPIAGGDAKKVYDDPSPAFASDATADGSRALIVRWNSASDLVLFEVDVAGGKGATRLYPPEGTKATINNAVYAPGGKLVYVATDEGKESSALLALDARSKAVKGRYVVDNPSTGSIGAMQVSPRGDRIAVGIDEGNHVEVRVLDAKKLTVQRTLKTP